MSSPLSSTAGTIHNRASPDATDGQGGEAGVGAIRSSSSSSSSPPQRLRSRPPRSFPLAPQPDLVRSLQKDEYMLSRWLDDLSELVSNVAGNSASSRWEAEVDLLARGSYYGVTSLSGQPTLGEEYCDLAQVVQRDPVQHLQEDAWEARAAIQQHQRRRREQAAGAAASSAAAASSTSPSLNTPSSPVTALPSPNASSSSSSSPGPARPRPRLFSFPRTPAFTVPSPARRVSLFGFQVLLPYLLAKAHAHSRQLVFSVPLPAQARGGYRLVAVQTASPWTDAKESLKRTWNRLFSAMLRLDLALAAHMNRGHLALFYLFGRYLELSKRLAGVQAVQLRTSNVARPGYQLFGVLLMLQVCVAIAKLTQQMIGAMRAAAAEDEDAAAPPHLPGLALHAAPSLVPDAGSASGLYPLSADDREDAAQEARERHLQPVHEAKHDESDEEDEDVPNCTLCLCPRKNTTATECGHLYCWECITECCTNKPECPMCRQPCALNTLVLLAHYQ